MFPILGHLAWLYLGNKKNKVFKIIMINDKEGFASCKTRFIIIEVCLIVTFIFLIIPRIVKYCLGRKIRSSCLTVLLEIFFALSIYCITAIISVLSTFSILEWYIAMILSLSIPLWTMTYIIKIQIIAERMRREYENEENDEQIGLTWLLRIRNRLYIFYIIITQGILLMPGIIAFNILTKNKCPFNSSL